MTTATARSAPRSVRRDARTVTPVMVEIMFRGKYDYRLLPDMRRPSPDAIRCITVPHSARMPMDPDLAYGLLRAGEHASLHDPDKGARYGVCFVPMEEASVIVVVDRAALPAGIDPQRVRPLVVPGIEDDVRQLLERDGPEGGTRGATYARAMGMLFLIGMHTHHDHVYVW